MKRKVFTILLLLFLNLEISAQIMDKRHIILKGTDLYNVLVSFILTQEITMDTSGPNSTLLGYVSLMDSNTADQSGIFMFGFMGIPLNKSYIFIKNKKSDKIKILTDYSLYNIQRKSLKFFKHNDTPDEKIVVCLYSLASFYEDIVYFKRIKKSRQPVY